MKYFSYVLTLLVLLSCDDEAVKTVEFNVNDLKHEDYSKNIIDLSTDSIMSYPYPFIHGEYLLLCDMRKGLDGKAIHIFDTKSLKYMASTASMGEDPGKIMRIGEVALSDNSSIFWVPDFAKLKLFKFNIDSAINNSEYLPDENIKFNNEKFLSRLKVLNESKAYGTGIQVLSQNEFRASLGLWDFQTNAVEFIDNEHPKLENQKVNALFDYSYSNNLMALAYTNCNLMTVFDDDANILFHLTHKYEPIFDNKQKKKFFGHVEFSDDLIFATYLGEDKMYLNEFKRPVSRMAEKILVFDLKGSLVKVIDLKEGIQAFTVDAKNNRIFCFFPNREAPIGYINL
ncbi:MAG: TolB-like 6-bladed beta-propeller domain-containing protein [Cyclobacteriaceae bacterium]|nr:hypothetical protein [Cyclobacteriaceae bacterium]MCH8517154.1 TolB-like 6-bladed beta-propeller domain-containing protein [Cyclobacteriaceae bacterium]